ncbi:MAG: hypothetical protein ACI4J8_03375 [Oscillospiraceae bacterium]
MLKKIKSLICTLLAAAVLLSIEFTATVSFAEDIPSDFVVTKYSDGNAVEGTDYTYKWDSEGRGCLTLLTDNLTVSMADGVSVTSDYIVSGFSASTSFSYGVHLDGVTINTNNSYAVSLTAGMVCLSNPTARLSEKSMVF